MKKNRSILCVLLLMVFGVNLAAQSVVFNNVRRVNSGTSGPIIKDKVLVGYYSFYKTDKIDRKQHAYSLTILDQNLKQLGQKDIIDGKHINLIEASFNGTALIMKFYDSRLKSVINRVYDTKANEVNKVIRKLEKKWEILSYSNPGSETEISNNSIYPIDHKGFVDIGIIKEKKLGYSLDFIPQGKENKKWRFQSRPTSEVHEQAEFLGANDEILTLLVSKSQGRNFKKPEQFLLALDVNTGKKLFEKKMGDSRFDLAPLNGYLSEDGKTVGILGAFYKKDANQNKAKTLGLFSYIFDKSGKMVNKNFSNWEKDLGKFVDVNEKGKMKGIGYIYFHEIVQTADGSIHAIGETYNRDYNPLKVYGAMPLGPRSENESRVIINVKDMVVLKFDEAFVIKDMKFFEKGSSTYTVRGGLFTSVTRLANAVYYYGGFDYLFTQRTVDNSEFTVGYTDYERGGRNSKLIYGGITAIEDGYQVDKVELRKGSYLSLLFSGDYYTPVLMAKPGYVVLAEYDRKTRRYTLNLEKVVK